MPLLDLLPVVSGHQVCSAVERTWVSLSMHNTRATWSRTASSILSALCRLPTSPGISTPGCIRARYEAGNRLLP